MERTIKNSHHSMLHPHPRDESNRKKVNFADDKNLPLYYIIEPDDDFSEYDEEDEEESFKKKYFVTNFSSIKEEDAVKRLNLNKICIYSINFIQNGNIKGRIYTKISCQDLVAVETSVYIIWSSDDWKTINTQESILIEQSRNHKIYVFNIENMINRLKIGSILELVACYKIDDKIFKDTNDFNFFKFYCYEKTIESTKL